MIQELPEPSIVESPGGMSCLSPYLGYLPVSGISGFPPVTQQSTYPQPFGFCDNRIQLAFMNPDIRVDSKSSDAVPETVADDGPDCNYTLTPVVRRVFIDRGGNEKHELEEIVTEITIAGNAPTEFVIRTTQIRQLTTFIANRYASATINCDVKKVEKRIENRFRNKIRAARVERIYVDAGWQMIDGVRDYVHDGKNPSPIGTFKTGKDLPSYNMSRENVGQIFVSACGLYRNLATIGTMLMFSLLGILYQVFDTAGFPPRFLRLLNGKTWSMKRTLALILFVPLEDDEHRDKLRRIDTDTPISMERGVAVSGRDTVTVFDDYSPAKSPSDKFTKEKNLELLIRMAGDGSTKSRSSIRLADRRGEGVQGVIAVTGEIIGHGLSSMLRCFFCMISRDDVSEETVSYFQEYPYLFTTFIRNFADYVGPNWDRFVDYIKKNFPKERELAKNSLRERRLIDAVCVLRLTADLTRDFLVNYCRVEQNKVNALICEIKNGIAVTAISSEALCEEESPADQIARVIGQLLFGGELVLIQKRPTKENFSEIDGFEEGNYYFFRAENLYIKIRDFLNSSGQKMMLDVNELAKLLVDEGIAKSSPNGKNKRTNFARIPVGEEKHVPFLKIFKNRIDEAMGKGEQ
ncbi:MAG: hypothetical protein LUE86_04780 [Clostridiales bacterium]|nr:hypothetical protein [Clostridiales bacterium]